MRDDPAMATFVKEVEKHPCLWNFTVKDYNKRETTDLAWKAIASEMGDTELNCRDRWKNIRCSFVRAHNNTKTKTRYYLADHLTFLLPYTKGKFGFDSYSIENDDRKEDEVLTDYVETTLDKPDETETESTVPAQCTSNNDDYHGDSSISSPSPQPAERERKSQKRRFTTPTILNNNKIVSDTKAIRVVSNSSTEDADLLFFRSMMPDIKKLRDKQKRVFKRKVLTLLEDLLDED